MRHPNRSTSPGPTPTPDPSAGASPCTPHAVTWSTVVDALREAGAHAGATAADWWAQDAVGGRATGDTTRTAHAVLAGIDDGDPAVLDALPGCDRSDDDDPTQAQLYAEAAPAGAPPWTALNAGEREEAADAYRDGFDTAAQDRVAQHCRAALPGGTGGTGDRPGSVAPRLRG
jgi:hypothetical protein